MNLYIKILYLYDIYIHGNMVQVFEIEKKNNQPPALKMKKKEGGT